MAACGLPVHAQEGAAAPLQVSLELRNDSVDSGLDDWHAVRLGVARTGTWTPGWFGALVAESRFGMSDAGVELGGYLPLDDRWLFQAEAGAVADADFLPHGYAEARITRRLPDGWLLSAGLRRARYPTAEVTKGALDVERYVGAWRLAYGFDLTRLHGSSLGSHEVGVDRYYGDRNVVGLRLAGGREASQRTSGGLVDTRTRGAWLRGSHWITPHWAFDWATGQVDQEATYDRAWVQVGFRREF